MNTIFFEIILIFSSLLIFSLNWKIYYICNDFLIFWKFNFFSEILFFVLPIIGKKRKLNEFLSFPYWNILPKLIRKHLKRSCQPKKNKIKQLKRKNWKKLKKIKFWMCNFSMLNLLKLLIVLILLCDTSIQKKKKLNEIEYVKSSYFNSIQIIELVWIWSQKLNMENRGGYSYFRLVFSSLKTLHLFIYLSLNTTTTNTNYFWYFLFLKY